MAQKKYIYILISVLALSYCLFKPVQLRLLTLHAPGCIPFETKAYFREVPLTKRYWWTRNQSLDKWPFYYKHSSIVSVLLLLGNKYFIIQNSGWNANFSSLPMISPLYSTEMQLNGFHDSSLAIFVLVFPLILPTNKLLWSEKKKK